jgi:hypothetical protein
MNKPLKKNTAPAARKLIIKTGRSPLNNTLCFSIKILMAWAGIDLDYKTKSLARNCLPLAIFGNT